MGVHLQQNSAARCELAELVKRSISAHLLARPIGPLSGRPRTSRSFIGQRQTSLACWYGALEAKRAGHSARAEEREGGAKFQPAPLPFSTATPLLWLAAAAAAAASDCGI